jgi:hypothetical protein
MVVGSLRILVVSMRVCLRGLDGRCEGDRPRTRGGVTKSGAATAGQFNVRRENARTLSRGAGLLLS